MNPHDSTKPPIPAGYQANGSYLPGSLYPSADVQAQGFATNGNFPQPMIAQPVNTIGYPPSSQPFSTQGEWVHGPVAPMLPPGLQYLSMVDQLLVRQQIETFEELLDYEMANKYIVQNNMGQNIYIASENSNCCARNCFGPLRSFDMTIKDHVGNEIIHLYRACACSCCLCFCCLQTMEVMAPPGIPIGTILQEWSILTPKFIIKNSVGELMLRIEGPICTCSMCGNVEFKVLSPDGETEVGKITKQWSGVLREMLTDADNFGVTFPMQLDVNLKAVLLGACFLIDFMFFENSPNKR